MAKAMTGRNAATTPTWDAPAALAGAAQPPLDLSLGHIGTTRQVAASDVAIDDIGPFRVVFDFSTMTGKVFTDASAFSSRAERRAAEREFEKVAARISRETGFALSKGKV